MWATSLSSLATSGAATIGGALNVTGATTLTGNLAVPGNLAVTGNFAVNTNKFTVAAASGDTVIAGTLGVTGAVTASGNLSALGTVGGNALSINGNAGITGDLNISGDTTIGNAGTDTLAIRSDNITVPNLTTVTVDLATDKVLIKDATDSKVRLITASSLGISATNAPQVKQTLYIDSTAGASPFVATSTSSGTEITVLTTSITPRSIASTVLVTIAINFGISGALAYGAFRITRNANEIGSNNVGSLLYGIAPLSSTGSTSGSILTSQFIQILDSPSSASAVTYKIHLYATGPTNFPSIWLNRTFQDVTNGVNADSLPRVSSSMILQEYFA